MTELGPLKRDSSAPVDGMDAATLPTLTAFTDALFVAVALFRVETPNLFCVLANPAFEAMMGTHRFALHGLSLSAISERFELIGWVDPFKIMVNEGSGKSFEFSHTVDDVDRFFRAELSICHTVGDGNGELLQLTIIDRSYEKHAEQQVIHNAMHDSLTGLPNRHLFQDRVERALIRSQRHDQVSLAVLSLNVDRFQLINENLGQLAGDEFLIRFAGRLQFAIRDGDTLARLGGDEFAVLLEDIETMEEATAVADRIHANLRDPLLVDGQRLVTSVSIGIAGGPGAKTQADRLLGDADFAMHAAKLAGKARTEIYRDDRHKRARDQFHLETDLRHAIESKTELELFYQPIIDFWTGEIAGVEALARWRHPERGLVSPMDFIPIAEETGLIVPLGRWAVEQATSAIAKWRALAIPASAHLFASVNVSGIQLANDDLVSDIESALKAHGLPGAALKIEITESALVLNSEAAIHILSALKDLNVGIALDDFGTGYSSLSYLQRFPIDVLKIDRGFVNDIEFNRENYKLVDVIIGLARTLGMEVVAEGVENNAQELALKRLNCRYGQGYFYARPMPAQDFEAYLLDTAGRCPGFLDRPLPATE
ncbi:MAG: EAL domain-containing protein [Pseudomonadota bacterium]